MSLCCFKPESPTKRSFNKWSYDSAIVVVVCVVVCCVLCCCCCCCCCLLCFVLLLLFCVVVVVCVVVVFCVVVVVFCLLFFLSKLFVLPNLKKYLLIEILQCQLNLVSQQPPINTTINKINLVDVLFLFVCLILIFSINTTTKVALQAHTHRG